MIPTLSEAMGALDALLSLDLEDADRNTGVLTCRGCGESNADNDPPEDDDIRHADGCEIVAARAVAKRLRRILEGAGI